MTQVSLNKFIASSGLCSRRQADRLIKEGKVKINGILAKPIDKVTSSDKVIVEGKEIKPELKKIYLAFNKPVGVICTTDKNSRDNIMSFIKIPERIFPIGRLDVNSSGLILLTNDGDFANNVLKSKTVEKEYEVEIDREVTQDFLRNLEIGMKIDGYPTLPAKTKKLTNRTFSMIIREGRKRQIRRMCDRLKANVVKLQRIRVGVVTLDNLKEKEYRTIPEEQIKKMEGLWEKNFGG